MDADELQCKIEELESEIEEMREEIKKFEDDQDETGTTHAAAIKALKGAINRVKLLIANLESKLAINLEQQC